MSQSAPPANVPTVVVALKWHVGDTPLPLELPVPAAPVEPPAVLPALRRLVDHVVAHSVNELEGTGGTVSCKEGCAACCRQLISISDIEAHAIAETIGRMPEWRRAQLMERFTAAERWLTAIKPADDIIEALNGAERRDFAIAYFRYGVACPFLEDERCSIYLERPLVCREYLVHTPAERCSRVGESDIGVVPTSHPSKALFRMSSIDDKRTETRVPLSLLPYWLARHPRTFKRAGGGDWMMRFVRSMEQADLDEEEAWRKARTALSPSDEAVT
ncbi:MAG: YkgJ family cysteine cluster protein [Alphaproteobacteria bacterium]|nr:YkgJ family cysteine cluster protein [Alphaproteobacteria bacterium]